MCSGDYFERSSPTMKCKLQAAARNFRQHAARGWVAALTNDVHLHEVYAGSSYQVQVTGIVRFMLAACDRHQFQFLESTIAGMVFRRQRLFEPGNVVLC